MGMGRRRRRILGVIAVLGMVFVGGVATGATGSRDLTVCLVRLSAVGCPSLPSLTFRPNGGFSPTALPRHDPAPIGLELEGEISTSDGRKPDALREVIVDLDKNGALDAAGLRACGRREIENLGLKGARRACRKSIVGAGVAHVAIGSSEQEPPAVPVPLTLFNGGVRNGTTTLFIHASVPGPSPTPIVTTVKVRKTHKGRYGLQAVAAIPVIADGNGSVLDFKLAIRRLFAYEGEQQSYAMARCIDGHLDSRVTSVFPDGRSLTGTLIRPCTPKPRPATDKAAGTHQRDWEK
jgi:hypothetical protein